MIKFAFILIQFFTTVALYAQDLIAADSVYVVVRSSEGDLNEDGVLDRVFLSIDTVSETRPVRLQIFFGQSDSTFELFFSSTKIVQPQYPAELNGEHNGNTVPDVDINEGNFEIEYYIKGMSLYKFRFLNGAFSLIHLSSVYYDGRIITETKFDLLTGKYSKLVELLDESEIIEDIEKVVLIDPLPKLKGFVPLVHELY